MRENLPKALFSMLLLVLLVVCGGMSAVTASLGGASSHQSCCAADNPDERRSIPPEATDCSDCFGFDCGATELRLTRYPVFQEHYGRYLQRFHLSLSPTSVKQPPEAS